MARNPDAAGKYQSTLKTENQNDHEQNLNLKKQALIAHLCNALCTSSHSAPMNTTRN
jgi:hypothetical protein